MHSENMGYLINLRMSKMCKQVAHDLELLELFKRFIELEFPEEESCHTRRALKNAHGTNK